jgi:S-DNA-T family DNA segregation ATPase FtsK/SpoIIIE
MRSECREACACAPSALGNVPAMDLRQGHSTPRSREPPAPWIVPADRPHPAIAETVATVGSLMREERLSEAIELLERITVEVPGSQLVLSAAHQVHFGDLLASARAPLCFPIGADADGEPLTCDLVPAGHLLVAGSNDAEKTSFLHSMICSLLMKTTPDELVFHLTDSKAVELTAYDGIPNLVHPCVTDAYEAVRHFKALVGVMEKRYRLAQQYGVRELSELNEKLPPAEKLPYILVVVDEIADVLAVDRKALQKAVTAITQRAQAVGMHLVLATQFPRGDVCSNALKHCLPDRIVFSTTSRAESRIVIGTTSAHELFGNGDCLYVHEKHAPVWVQSPYVTSADVTLIVDHWKDQIGSTGFNKEHHV